MAVRDQDRGAVGPGPAARRRSRLGVGAVGEQGRHAGDAELGGVREGLDRDQLGPVLGDVLSTSREITKGSNSTSDQNAQLQVIVGREGAFPDHDLGP